MGLAEKPPPQFGHTFSSNSSTQILQKVHSKEQIMASVEWGGSEQLQCSQLGLSVSIGSKML